jgi:hypothetical protein
LKPIVVSLFFLLWILAAKAQTYSVNDEFLNTYNHLLNFDKKKTSEGIKQELSKSPRNLLMYYLESGLFFVEALLSETSSSYTNWLKKFSFWEKQFEKGDKNSPYYNYCIAHLYFQRGLLAMKHSDYIQAGFDIRKASRMLESNHKKFPGFFIQYKELGILNCFIGNIPEQFEWLTGIAGLKGDLVGGEKKLKKILDLSMSRPEFSFLQVEGLLYYSTVVTVLYNDPDRTAKLIGYFQKVSPVYNKSPLLIFLKAEIFSHAGFNDKALNELAAYSYQEGHIRFDYISYFRGMLLLQKGNTEAKHHFSTFISRFGGMHYIKSAYQKIAWCWLMDGDQKQYDLYMSLARNAGRAVNDADKQALQEAKSNRKPHPELLRARLLSDGGYYKKALEQLNEIDSVEVCSQQTYCVEFLYRKARIFHLSDNVNDAIEYYLKTIEEGRSDKEYFAANSALMLGMIYEERGDKASASKYYRMVQEMPFEEYRNSIQQKAKAGMQRVG